MEIDYHQNPLRSQVYLDDTEKKLLKANIKNEYLLEALAAVWYQFRTKEPPNLEKIKEEVSFFDEDEKFDDYIDALYDTYISELEGGYTHIGDCTCIPSTCFKCLAEEHAGIDTIKGLGKHQAAKIHSAFKDKYTTLEEAIDFLSKPISEEPNAEYVNHPEMYRTHLPRWQSERISALKWLEDYRLKHFTKLSGYSAHSIIMDEFVNYGQGAEPWLEDK
jgi:hypothetical protein